MDMATVLALLADPFDKSRLSECHQAAKQHHAYLFSTCLYKLSFTVPGSKQRRGSTNFPELSELRPMLLGGRLQDQDEVIYQGRVIYGTLCVDPFRVHGVMSVLETPESGGRAVRVSIYDFDPGWERKYAAGKKVAIKEPYFKRGNNDGILHIRVDHPSSIEEVSSFAAANDYTAAAALKAEGNRFFGLKKWDKAIDLYTQCIRKCEAALALGGGDQDALKVAVLLPALSNRAEALLKLGEFDRALADSERALAMDVGHLKSICRKARALKGLQENEKAVAWLKKAMKVAPCKELEDMLKACRLH